jgi:hypothetical protein
VTAFAALVAVMIWVAYQAPARVPDVEATTPPPSIPVVPVKKQKSVHHKTKQEENEAQAQKYKSQSGCEIVGFVWHDDVCHAYTEPKPLTVHDQQPKSWEMRVTETHSLKTQDACQAAGYLWDVMHDECRATN